MAVKSDGPSSRQMLVQLRDQLRLALASADKPVDIAALSREFRQVTAALDAMPEEVEVSHVDALAAKRAARRSVPESAASANRRSQPRRGDGVRRTSGGSGSAAG